jgi:hypothetical protein
MWAVASALEITGTAGLRVQVKHFLARLLISIGFGDVPISVPVGRLMHPYPCPAGLLPAGMRVFYTRCHLYCCGRLGGYLVGGHQLVFVFRVFFSLHYLLFLTYF